MPKDDKILLLLGELKGTTEAVLEQTKKTNGRVSTLETRVDIIEKQEAYDKGFSKGKIAVLSILGTALLFIVGRVLIPLIFPK